MTRLLTFLRHILTSVPAVPAYGASRMPSMVLFTDVSGYQVSYNLKYAVGKASKHTLRHRLINANSEDGIRAAAAGS